MYYIDTCKVQASKHIRQADYSAYVFACMHLLLFICLLL